MVRGKGDTVCGLLFYNHPDFGNTGTILHIQLNIPNVDTIGTLLNYPYNIRGVLSSEFDLFITLYLLYSDYITCMKPNKPFLVC